MFASDLLFHGATSTDEPDVECRAHRSICAEVPKPATPDNTRSLTNCHFYWFLSKTTGGVVASLT
jgi:hypothetical protein